MWLQCTQHIAQFGAAISADPHSMNEVLQGNPTLLTTLQDAWPRIEKAAQRDAEAVCAEFRRRAAVLDGLKFHTLEDRDAVLGRLRAGEGGHGSFGLLESHQLSDQTTQRYISAVRVKASFLGLGSPNNDYIPLLRLQQSLTRFDSAWKRAEQRFPIGLLKQWRSTQRPPAAEGGDEPVCAVCMCELVFPEAPGDRLCAEFQKLNLDGKEAEAGAAAEAREEEDSPLQLPCGHR